MDVIDTDMATPLEPKRLLTIFKAFQWVETGMAQRDEGTGLGLTIVRSLCEMVGCRLAVDSEVGKGSIFSIVPTP